VKGHKGVYQFLSIPYETEGCDQEVKASSSTPTLVGSSEHSVADFHTLTSDCNERLTDRHEVTANNWAATIGYRENTETDCRRTVDNREQADDSFDESSHSREESWSSDSSSKSLDELQADLLNTDVFGHPAETMDFVFDDGNTVGTWQDGDLLNWQKL
jgi:hypothetical protein